MTFDFNNKRQVHEDSNKIKYAPAKRYLAKWQWYLLVLIILSPLLYFAGRVLIDSLTITASGYVSYNTLAVRAPENGYIGKVLVKEGEHIKLDQLLISMNAPRLTKELNKLREEQERLKNIQDNTENPEIEYFLLMKKALQKHVQTTIEYVKKMEDLRRKKLGTIIDEQKARTDLKNIELEIADIDRAIAKSNLSHTFRMEEVYGEILRGLDISIIKIEATMTLMNIASTGEGNIAKILARSDEYVTKGQTLIEITTHDNQRILAYLDHKDMSNDIYKGKKVTVIFPNNIRIAGEIEQLPALAERQDKATNIIRTVNNKVLLIISLKGKLPPKYQIDGLPVKVILKDYGFGSFIR